MGVCARLLFLIHRGRMCRRVKYGCAYRDIMYTDFSAIKENVCQLDNPANFADEVKLHAATGRLAVICQQMDQFFVCA